MSKVDFISIRKHRVQRTPNPRPIKHYDVQMDEHGKKKFVETPTVAPSMAEDYSVSQNALLNRSGSAQYRSSSDVVDFGENYIKLVES